MSVSVEERECADSSVCGGERVCRCEWLWRRESVQMCVPVEECVQIPVSVEVLQYWQCPNCLCADFLSSWACSCSADLCLTLASSFAHYLLHVIFSIKSPSTFFPSDSGRVSAPPFGSMSICSFLSWQQLNYFTMVCRPGSWVVLWAHWKWLPSSCTLCTIPTDEVGYLVLLCGVWMVCAGLDPTASGVWSHVDRLTIFFPTIDLLLGLRNLIYVEKERKEKHKHMWEVTKGLKQTVRWKQRKTPKWCDRGERSSMKGDQGCLLLKGEQKWEYLS